MKKFEYFEVTADIGFKAYGKNLNEAFENAGLAIFNIISDTNYINPTKEISFEITSEDNVSMLYDYLEELLFYHEVEFMLFSEFSVEISEGFSLKATIMGEEIDWDKHERKSEIKAITFHKMEVLETNPVKLQAIVDL
ncbi:archease family protein [Methanobrevibacter gottschalkii]|uniref:Protein archease n=2 Tax=Methanobrevibacter gottschalkii TaxID=190974 RepID=A0A3N5BCC9_9EURY|nr:MULTISPECIES: archease [Methanobrevibacter]MCQ2971322.1 archease [archaeon]OEC99190.1 archease [Methanobrevibacter sp. A27]RPF53050.1 archease family protein [Methanobrevibacter gottschalkii DSM 11977]SEK55606.1 archease family protein [Methanobrevibacter gottschalkii]